MRGRFFRASARVAATVVVVAGLAACEQILGLDDQLTQADEDDGGGDGGRANDGSVGDSGAPDATSGTNDGGVVDGGPGGDAGGDAAPLVPGPWHLDTGFGGGIGYVELPGHSVTSAAPGGLALLNHPSLGVVVVALSADGRLYLYTVSDSPAMVRESDILTDGVFAGAIVTPDAGFRVLTEQTSVNLTLHDLLAPDFADTPQNIPLTDDVTIGNIIGVTDAGVSAVGNSGSFGDRVAGQFDISSEIDTTPLPWANMQAATLLKTELTVGDTTYYGGLDDLGSTGKTYPVWAVTSAGFSRTGLLGAGVDDGSGFTDLFALDGQVFAVGFSDSSFIFSPIPPPTDAGTPFAILPVVPANADDFYFSANRDPGADSPLNAEVDVQKRILVGGYFGAVNLGNFLVDGGSDPQAFAEPEPNDGVIEYASAIELSKYLTDLGSDDWAFHSMLIGNDSNLYVTAADTDGDGHWVVIRLVRGTP